jgi:hypothetical protein
LQDFVPLQNVTKQINHRNCGTVIPLVDCPLDCQTNDYSCGDWSLFFASCVLSLVAYHKRNLNSSDIDRLCESIYASRAVLIANFVENSTEVGMRAMLLRVLETKDALSSCSEYWLYINQVVSSWFSASL